MNRRRKICFVTGTRAEFGLMRTTLEAIRSHKRLSLQLIVTGMHLDPRHGRSIESIRAAGWLIDKVVPWPPGKNATDNATATGGAIAHLTRAFESLQSDIVLVTGDRVEAFAAATAAHVSQRPLAHIHGGDRALGQVDDALRHAITKLAHLHFPATARSAQRIRRLGEDPWRLHLVGSPGVDGITTAAASGADLHRTFADLEKHYYALVVLHPTSTVASVENAQATKTIRAVMQAGFSKTVVIYPNNDPGSAGIIRAIENFSRSPKLTICRDLPRDVYLGLMRDAAVLVGNSSSGMIESASFGTPVVNIGPRQAGREHSANVTHVPLETKKMTATLAMVWNKGQPRRSRARNVYGGSDVGARIASVLAKTSLGPQLLSKLITF